MHIITLMKLMALSTMRSTHSMTKAKATLTKVVHNRKYMDENPEAIVDTSKLKDEDLHDWKLVGKVVEPTLETGRLCRLRLQH